MKFTLFAILPAFLWTVLWYVVDQMSGNAEPGVFLDFTIVFSWFLTAAVIGLYWAARIVRFALRSPRAYKPAPWDPRLR